MKCAAVIAEKDHWVRITDPTEAAALLLNGKYDNAKPTTVKRGDDLFALIDEPFKAWRESRSGKRL